MEKWKQIPNTHYQVSNLGRVKNINSGRILKQQYNGRGYKSIRIMDNSYKKISFTVHRLVALAFCDNPNRLAEVNHIDGDKNNNKADNLCWCTRSENIKHAWDNNLRHFTDKTKEAVINNLKKANTPEVLARKKYPRSKATICVETGQVFASIKAAADFVNACEQNVQACCASNGKRTCRGYHWKYAKITRR